MDDYTKLMQIFQQNADRTFVQRILRPDDFPVLPHEDGVATHRMSWSDQDGKYYVYPTVLWDGKGLKDYGDSAFDMAMRSGNVIEFPSAQDADWFTKNYKSAWGGRRNYMQEWERNRFNYQP